MASSSFFKVRLAELRDLPRVTKVCLDGLPDDPTFDFPWRHRRQYPDDNYFFWLQRFKDDLFDPKKTFIVAEEAAPVDSEREDRGEAIATIIAFAVWERNYATKGYLNTMANLSKHVSLRSLHRGYSRPELGNANQISKLCHQVGELGHK
jgi:hypothetical protein